MGRLTETMIICGRDCEDCRYSTFDESDISKIMVYCSQKEKWYIFGQCIPCDLKERSNDKA